MYNKPTKTFCLAKSTKRMMATMVDSEMRNAYKNAMIQAQLESAVKPKEKKDRDE